MMEVSECRGRGREMGNGRRRKRERGVDGRRHARDKDQVKEQLEPLELLLCEFLTLFFLFHHLVHTGKLRSHLPHLDPRVCVEQKACVA
jgi:hypothetical protein